MSFVSWILSGSRQESYETSAPRSGSRPVNSEQLLQKLRSVNQLFFNTGLLHDDLVLIDRLLRLRPDTIDQSEQEGIRRIIGLIDKYEHNPNFAGTSEKSNELAEKIFSQRKQEDQELILNIKKMLSEPIKEPQEEPVYRERYFEPIRKKKESIINIQQERNPPPNQGVTAVFDRDGRKGRAYAVRTVFDDHAILQKEFLIKKVTIGNAAEWLDINVMYTKNNKAIIQQNKAVRGSVGPCIVMLLMDNGKIPDGHRVMANFDSPRELYAGRDIERAGLKPIINHIHAIKELGRSRCDRTTENYRAFSTEEREELEHVALEELKELIKANGSAFVTFGEHSDAVVVDYISADLSQVRLRDPYHGWEITVKGKAFVEKWQKYEGIKGSDDEPCEPFVLQVAQEKEVKKVAEEKEVKS